MQNITKEYIENLYIKERKSSRQIAKLIGRSQNTVMHLLVRYGIRRRSYKENPMPVPKGSHLPVLHREAISEAMTDNPKNWMRGRVLTKNPQWKGGKRVYRRMKLSEVPLACALCGAREIRKVRSNLYVHHLDGNRDHNFLDNLQVLCASCHKRLHSN